MVVLHVHDLKFWKKYAKTSHNYLLFPSQWKQQNVHLVKYSKTPFLIKTQKFSSCVIYCLNSKAAKLKLSSGLKATAMYCFQKHSPPTKTELEPLRSWCWKDADKPFQIFPYKSVICYPDLREPCFSGLGKSAEQVISQQQLQKRCKKFCGTVANKMIPKNLKRRTFKSVIFWVATNTHDHLLESLSQERLLDDSLHYVVEHKQSRRKQVHQCRY